MTSMSIIYNVLKKPERVKRSVCGFALATLVLATGTAMVNAAPSSSAPPVPRAKPVLEDVLSQEDLAALTHIAPAGYSGQDQFQAEDFDIVWRSARTTKFIPKAKPIHKNTVLPTPRPLIDATGALSDKDAARYEHIFVFQDIGDWDAADVEISKLTDLRLMGHVLYQRYMHPTKYKASYAELKTWMDQYADHPHASKVYHLAMARKPAEANAPKSPVKFANVLGGLDFGKRGVAYQSPRKRTYEEKQTVRKIKRDIGNWLSKDMATHSYSYLQKDEHKKILDKTEYDILKSEIASSYFFNRKFDKAYELASSAADRSGTDAPLAGWIAGITAWKLERYKDSAQYFELSAQSKRASEWTTSASAFWAARAHLRARNPKESTQWLKTAAEHPRTFYGLIASQALGVRTKFNWDAPKLTKQHVDALEKTAPGRRAMALLDARQPQLAELELKRINPGNNDLLRDALVAIADKASLPALAMRLGSAFTDSNGKLYDTALFPVAPWEPESGFEVDRALIYAFIRQESRFDPSVKNRSGAHGLMQLMPRTAAYLADQSFRGKKKRDLLDPMLNIDLGQKYLSDLLENRRVDNDLFRLAVAYNAGPGNLARWENKMTHGNDPLMFIEEIPVAETRAFVERVLTNYWIYRIRLGQPTPSLDAIAAGDWPRYAAFDGDGVKFASLLRVK